MLPDLPLWVIAALILALVVGWKLIKFAIKLLLVLFVLLVLAGAAYLLFFSSYSPL
jgi:hypothetical protein